MTAYVMNIASTGSTMTPGNGVITITSASSNLVATTINGGTTLSIIPINRLQPGAGTVAWTDSSGSNTVTVSWQPGSIMPQPIPERFATPPCRT